MVNSRPICRPAWRVATAAATDTAFGTTSGALPSMVIWHRKKRHAPHEADGQKGVDAIWLSNHAGRQFDGGPATIEQLLGLIL